MSERRSGRGLAEASDRARSRKPQHRGLLLLLGPFALSMLGAPAGAVTCPPGQPADPPAFCDVDLWFSDQNNPATAIKNPRKANGTPQDLWVPDTTDVWVWAEFFFDRSDPGGASPAEAALTPTGKLLEQDLTPGNVEIDAAGGPLIPAIPAAPFRVTGLVGPFHFKPILVPDGVGDPDIVDFLTSNVIEDDATSLQVFSELTVTEAGSGDEWSSNSVAFEIAIWLPGSPIPPGVRIKALAATPVPTMSRWGLIACGLLLLTAIFVTNGRHGLRVR